MDVNTQSATSIISLNWGRSRKKEVVGRLYCLTAYFQEAATVLTANQLSINGSP
jgi:hypothetical protein